MKMPRPSTLRPLLLALCLALPFSGHAESAAEGGVRIDRFLNGLFTLKAHFRQQVTNSDKMEESHAAGVFYLQRPDRLRWDYETPFKQEIVADGTRVWVLDTEIEQVSVKYQNQALAGTPALLLVGDQPARTILKSPTSAPSPTVSTGCS